VAEEVEVVGVELIGGAVAGGERGGEGWHRSWQGFRGLGSSRDDSRLSLSAHGIMSRIPRP
jgi:hypothetical protein